MSRLIEHDADDISRLWLAILSTLVLGLAVSWYLLFHGRMPHAPGLSVRVLAFLKLFYLAQYKPLRAS